MSKYSVEITNINTNNLNVLNNKEMNELFIGLKNGKKENKDIIVNGNFKLVLSIVKRFNNKNTNLDDLFQVGVIGLIKAVDNFDLSYNCLFSTYAVPLILGEIKRYIRDNTQIRISRGIKDNAYLILNYKENYFNNYGKEASIDDIKRDLNLEEYDIRLALNSLKDVYSLYDPIYSDNGDTIYLFDQLADNSQNVDKESLISLYKALDCIKKREREVLENRYFYGMTQSEIASSLNISQAQVSRIEKNAVLKLKKIIE